MKGLELFVVLIPGGNLEDYKRRLCFEEQQTRFPFEKGGNTLCVVAK